VILLHAAKSRLWSVRNGAFVSRPLFTRDPRGAPIAMGRAMSLSRVTPLLLVLATACSPIALSPALRAVPLETAETAREGHVAVRASGGAHTSVYTAGGGIGVGVAPDVEVQLEGTFADVEQLNGRRISPFVGTGRIGLKHRLLECLAVTAGVGAGAGPWGAFSGGDLGIILAYENPYVIPFFAARMQFSVPINPQTELASDGNGGTLSLSPTTTFWFQPSSGIRIPFCHEGACDGTRVSLTLAVAWTQMYEMAPERTGSGIGFEGGITVEP
jgi:hypothetical protein